MNRPVAVPPMKMALSSAEDHAIHAVSRAGLDIAKTTLDYDERSLLVHARNRRGHSIGLLFVDVFASLGVREDELHEAHLVIDGCLQLVLAAPIPHLSLRLALTNAVQS